MTLFRCKTVGCDEIVSAARGPYCYCEEHQSHRGKTPSRNKVRRASVTRAVREHVLERDGYRCVHCGTTAGELDDVRHKWMHSGMYQLHIDHVIPAVNGGPAKAWNLVAACPRCNLSRQHRGFDLVLLAQNWMLEAAT